MSELHHVSQLFVWAGKDDLAGIGRHRRRARRSDPLDAIIHALLAGDGILAGTEFAVEDAADGSRHATGRGAIALAGNALERLFRLGLEGKTLKRLLVAAVDPDIEHLAQPALFVAGLGGIENLHGFGAGGGLFEVVPARQQHDDLAGHRRRQFIAHGGAINDIEEPLPGLARTFIGSLEGILPVPGIGGRHIAVGVADRQGANKPAVLEQGELNRHIPRSFGLRAETYRGDAE